MGSRDAWERGKRGVCSSVAVVPIAAWCAGAGPASSARRRCTARLPLQAYILWMSPQHAVRQNGRLTDRPGERGCPGRALGSTSRACLQARDYEIVLPNSLDYIY